MNDTPRPYGFVSFVQKRGYHSLYIVTTVEEGGPIKIGIADDPLKRFAALQSANWVPIRLHHWWWMAGRPLTERAEAAFKERHAPLQIRGEWFRMTPDEAKASAHEIGKGIANWIADDSAIMRRIKKVENAADKELRDWFHRGKPLPIDKHSAGRAK